VQITITLPIALTIVGTLFTILGFVYKVGYDVGKSWSEKKEKELSETVRELSEAKNRADEFARLNLMLQGMLFKKPEVAT
jgi:hypothetical protein